MESGVPVCILEDQHGFILHHEELWKGSDVDHAAPMIEAAQARFPDLCTVRFGRGFHSPANRPRRLDDLLDTSALPKAGYLSRGERRREQGEAFIALCIQHPAVESAINTFEHRGLDRVRAHGADGFARMVALSVVALNLHRIGLVLRKRARQRRRRVA